MYERILFPTDGSEGAKIAFGHVLDVAAGTDATVHVLNVVDTAEFGGALGTKEYNDWQEREAQRIVREATDRARARDVSAVTEVIQGDPARSISDYAEQSSADLIVMPTHGRSGLERFLLGSVTEKVIRTADVPVLTLRPDESLRPYPYRSILLPTDGSEAAGSAIDEAILLGSELGASLYAVYVVDVRAPPGTMDPDVVYDALEAQGKDALEDIRERAATAGLDHVEASLLTGTPHESIRDFADEEEIDLIVMGTHGRRGVERYMLGSVTERVVRTSDRPVLTVR